MRWQKLIGLKKVQEGCRFTKFHGYVSRHWGADYKPFAWEAPIPLNVLYRWVVKLRSWVVSPSQTGPFGQLEATRAMLSRAVAIRNELQSENTSLRIEVENLKDEIAGKLVSRGMFMLDPGTQRVERGEDGGPRCVMPEHGEVAGEGEYE